MEKLQIQKFGITKDGSKPYLYKMKNDAGMEVQVSDFGATLVNVTVLDQDKNRRRGMANNDRPFPLDQSERISPFLRRTGTIKRGHATEIPIDRD